MKLTHAAARWRHVFDYAARCRSFSCGGLNFLVLRTIKAAFCNYLFQGDTIHLKAA
jgi:hypothetical protein